MSTFPPIRKAVFPVAGLGTRFLPATKAVPKEMLPVVDKPLIQYAVEEAAEAGIDTMVLVTRGDKPAITAHFDPAPELEEFLAVRGKDAALGEVRGILPRGVKVLEAIQERPLGLGHAVLCARNLIGNEPFAVVLPDDMIRSPGVGCLQQMVGIYERTGCPVIGVEEIPLEWTERYGVVAVEEDQEGLLSIRSIVEKPRSEDAPSNLGVVGRYILTADLFPLLETLGAGAGGEIQLTDGIARLMGERTVLAYPFAGQRYDCGSRLGLVQATLDYAMQDSELAVELDAFLSGAGRGSSG
jgi:UTP--glucose-1-phosphate uridylyltransferase